MRTLRMQLLTILLATSASVSLAQGWCSEEGPFTAPDSRYTVLTDTSQVKDNETTLIWQRCSLGQTWNDSTCAGAATAMTWAEALTQATAAGSSGFAWRLPNFKELLSLAELACYNPAINSRMFPQTGYLPYWSSTSIAHRPFEALFAYFLDSRVGAGKKKSDKFSVRLVRSSQ